MSEMTAAYLERVNSVLESAAEKIELEKNQISIGRGIGNDVIWESLQISRQHVTLKYARPNWMIKDTSTNGIVVNGLTVPRNKWVALKDNDLIAFIRTGDLEYRFPDQDGGSSIREKSRRLATTVKVKQESSSTSSNSVSSRKRKASVDVKPVSKRNRSVQARASSVKIKKEEEDEEEEEDDDDDVSFVKESPKKPQSQTRKGTKKKDSQQASSSTSKTIKDEDVEFQKRLTDYEARLDQLEREKAVVMRELVETQKQLEERDSADPLQEGLQKELLESMDTELSCSVCNEIYVNASVINCGHTFCSYCITEWLKVKPECPTCRRTVTMTERNISVENILAKLIPLLPQETLDKREEFLRERRATEVAANAPTPPPTRGGARGRGRGRGRGVGRGGRGRGGGNGGGGAAGEQVVEIGVSVQLANSIQALREAFENFLG